MNVGRMKPLERSPTRLRLEHFGWYYGAISAVFGALCLYAAANLWSDGDIKDSLIFAGLGGGASLILGLVATRRFTVTLDRAAGIVHVRNGSVLGVTVRSAPLSCLTQAHLQTSKTGDLTLYRLVLLFDDRDGWVVTRMYTSGDGTMRAVDMINSWLTHYVPGTKEAHEDHQKYA